MKKKAKDYKFVGNNIPLATYNKLIAHSESTGRKIKSILNDAINQYLSKNNGKITAREHSDGSKIN